jgi:hypothetical protein
MDELLGVDYRVAEKDRLYRCLDRLLGHKQGLFVWLKQRWADLFEADFEVLLYDLTSTYFEGEMEQNRKAKRGYSRDGWPDCLQVVIALVITLPPPKIHSCGGDLSLSLPHSQGFTPLATAQQREAPP